MKFAERCFALASTCLAAAALLMPVSPAQAAENAAPTQDELLRVLRSDAPPQEKAITCKKLAIYGNKEAVPALAVLLPDPQLSSWARIALEAIPDPAADAALREALHKAQGRQLVGVINSIAVRRDSKAVDELIRKLAAPEADIASASAEALGKIGGAQAAKALEKAFAGARPEVLSSLAEGCILCAEHFLAAGKGKDAARLYDLVRQSPAPRTRILEATRGAILARGSGGIPLLLEQLHSPDRHLYGIGLRSARELRGADVTKALLKELDSAVPGRESALLLAIADRQDPAVMPKVLSLAQGGKPEVRRTAIGLLERFGDPACVAVLLQAASETDAELARTAKAGLSRLEGTAVDNDLLARLSNSTGRTRQVLIELAKLRRLHAAIPVIVQSAEDADADIRRTAVDSLGSLGSEAQAGDLARLLAKAKTDKERGEVERALVAICSRLGKPTLPHVVPLTKNSESGLREVGLRALASIGGPDALAAVQAAVTDASESVQDEAVGTLATWPGNWPEDVGVAATLLDLAKSGRKPAHRIQGMRGFLQFVEENQKLSADDKIAKVRELLPVVERPEEKRRVVAVVSGVPTGKALDLLVSLAQEQGLVEEASQAILKVATSNNLKDAARDQRAKALQTVLDKSQNEGTRTKAGDALKKLP